MKLEQQVCSLELAKRLKEFGVKQESYFHWTKEPDDTWMVCHSDEKDMKCGIETPSAFTVAELSGVFVECGLRFILSLTAGNYYLECKKHTESDKEMADCMAKMLIYLIENGLHKAAPEEKMKP